MKSSSRCRRLLPFVLLSLLGSGGACCWADEGRSPIPVFSRAQLKYGLDRTDYHNKWVDRPLFVDPSLSHPEDERLSKAGFRKTREIVMQYGLRGLGFFPEFNRSYFYDLIRDQPMPGFEILTDFGPDQDLEKKVLMAGKALENPSSFRIDGKVVIVSYRADSRAPEFWKEAFQKIREAHGDSFLFLPSFDSFAGEPLSRWASRFDAGSITPEQESNIKESLRQWARSTDGLYYAGPANLKGKDRVLHEAFYRGFVIRHMREVLAEPEFAGKKYFGLSACIGHENCTRLGYTLSSDGTATLRRSMEAALDARPDLIVIPEWDEQNENSSIRPTVYNGRTAMRLLRHYTSQEQGRLQEPLPGDDTGIPNLVLSYRKRLVLGEKLKLELLHIPETGVSENQLLTARIELTNGASEIVWTSQELEIPPGKLWEHVETLPSESFAKHDYLLPVVKVRTASGERVFSDGFQAMDFRASWNWDCKWVMQPLREILVPSQCELNIAAASEPDLYEFTVKFAADEPLAYVEILDNDDVIYSHETVDPMPRETARTAVFRIDWQSLESLSSKRRLQGSVTLKHAEGQWIVPDKMSVKGQRIAFGRQTPSHWVRRALLSLPKDQLDRAVLDIDLPGIWQGELPLRQVYEKEIQGFPGPMGFNLVVSRFLRQDRMPFHLDTRSVAFTVPVRPDLPRSRLQLQAVAASGKVYRSRPLILGAPVGSTQTLDVFSDTENQPMAIEVDAASLPDIVYDFAPDETGSVLRTRAGRPFWGILGGYSSQATGRGGGESIDGTPFLEGKGHPVTATPGLPDDEFPTAPAWEEISPGVHALAFNGKSTYLTLPQGGIPRRTGYEIRMEILPDHVEGKQILIANRAHYPGSLTVYLEGGVLKAHFLTASSGGKTVDSGLNIEAGKWTDVRVRYDQKTLAFHVDERSSEPLPLPGPGIYDTVSVVGGYGDEWFSGKLKSLRIRHGSRPEIP